MHTYVEWSNRDFIHSIAITLIIFCSVSWVNGIQRYLTNLNPLMIFQIIEKHKAEKRTLSERVFEQHPREVFNN